MARARLTRPALVLLAALSGACGAPPPSEPTRAPAPLAEPELGGFAQGAAIVSSAAQGVRFPLPDAARWSIRDGGSGGLIATHAPTRSRLVLRAFRHDPSRRQDSCEAQARDADRTIPVLGVERVDARRLELARDYPLELAVAVVPVAGDAAEPGLRGDALAFGGDGRRCLSVVFSTIASGPRAAAVLAERLGLIVGSTFARMRLRSIDERVREPFR